MPSFFISAIVLAAGESRRMGNQNKLLLPFGDIPLIAHVVETILRSDAHEVIVVVGHEADRVRDALTGYNVTFAHNPHYRDGMTTSIRAGVAAASPDAAGFMICLSDLPLIEPTELNHLAATFRQAIAQDPRHIIRPVHRGTPGNPVLFPVHYRPALLAHQGLMGCKGIVKQHREQVIEVEMATDHVLCDVDTPDTYQALTSHVEKNT